MRWRRTVCVVAMLLAAIAITDRAIVRMAIFGQPAEDIEAYLLVRTPIGETQPHVLEWLRSVNVEGMVHEVNVEIGSQFPPSRVGGRSFIHETIWRYGLLVETSVEAFYVFDANGYLAEVSVIKTSNSL